ncbi:hypothetical protein AB1N83_005615 [Pleurotus pulmonarius]
MLIILEVNRLETDMMRKRDGRRYQYRQSKRLKRRVVGCFIFNMDGLAIAVGQIHQYDENSHSWPKVKPMISPSNVLIHTHAVACQNNADSVHSPSAIDSSIYFEIQISRQFVVCGPEWPCSEVTQKVHFMYRGRYTINHPIAVSRRRRGG